MKNETRVYSFVPHARPAASPEDKNELGASIARIRQQRGLSRPQLAEKLGMTLGGVSAWEYGRTRPDLGSLKRLCEALDVSSDELLGVESGLCASPEERELLLSWRRLPQNEQRYVAGLISLMLGEGINPQAVHSDTAAAPVRTRRPRRQMRSFPLSPLSMCAGEGIYLSDGGQGETIRLVACDALKNCDEVVRISGDSMEPRFHDGDLALVQHTQSLSEGEVGVFVIDGEGMIKTYQRDGLHPLNPAYPVIHPGEDSDVRCFGRVLGRVEEDMLP